jgi:hypothetical protein
MCVFLLSLFYENLSKSLNLLTSHQKHRYFNISVVLYECAPDFYALACPAVPATVVEQELWKVWVYAMLATFCVCLTSLAGVVFMIFKFEFINAHIKELLGLGAGTLIGK